MLVPTSIEELASMVRAHDGVLAVGGATKSRLARHADASFARLSTCRLSGITEYEPSEYTFTALAGTPVAVIAETLAAKGQFLPCSALLRAAGATLGGSIASGLSGSGRFRFGGIRDFLLGIRYVSGEGRLIAGGGKVVKNAAGFDLPKFMVGSLGRFGILAEVTFKVFPMPSATLTVRVECPSHAQAAQCLTRAAASRWELSALDYDARERAIYLRLGGPSAAIESIADEIVRDCSGDARRLERCAGDAYWDRVREFEWADGLPVMVKVPVNPRRIPQLQEALESGALEGTAAHYSVGGNVAYLALPDSTATEALSQTLISLNLSGLTILGGPELSLWLGIRRAFAIESAVKQALDPCGRFPSLHDCPAL